MTDQAPTAQADGPQEQRSGKSERVAAWFNVVINFLILLVLGAGGYIAFQQWDLAQVRRTDEATISYVNALTQTEHTRALWYLQRFTICFENDKGPLGGGTHLSYLTLAEINARKDANAAVAKKWWRLIENDDHVEDTGKKGYCGKKKDIEENLFLVWSRLEALASCAAMKICDLTKVVKPISWKCDGPRPKDQLVESFDCFTVLSISNYLILSSAPGVSREWDAASTAGNFKTLIEQLEKYGECIVRERREQIWLGRLGGPQPEY